VAGRSEWLPSRWTPGRPAAYPADCSTWRRDLRATRGDHQHRRRGCGLDRSCGLQFFGYCLVRRFGRYHLACHLGLLWAEGLWKATLPGTDNATSVPAPVRLRTLSRPPIFSTRSCIPSNHLRAWFCDPGAGGTTPSPSSRKITRKRLALYSTLTSMLFAREWRKALTNTSLAIIWINFLQNLLLILSLG